MKRTMGRTQLCGKWTTKHSMHFKRKNFAAASGPPKNAASSVTGLNQDPRVYVFGGSGEPGSSTSAEFYNPNTDQWKLLEIENFPDLPNCAAVYVPNYAPNLTDQENVSGALGYIYILGVSPDNKTTFYQYDIQKNTIEELSAPPLSEGSVLEFLDDFGGPLAELFIAVTDVDLPACSDSKTIWAIGGKDTLQETYYAEVDLNGKLTTSWIQGPKLPLKRTDPLIGRVFWRDAGVTSFGVSNCASIIVAGGKKENGRASRKIQMLVRKNCNWKWIWTKDNPTDVPKKLLTLAVPVAEGAFGTEQWPETLVTGGRPILFGGIPPNRTQDAGSVQYAQIRFFDGRYRRDPDLEKGPHSDSLWNITTSMPGNRTFFRSCPLSQENSSDFGGRRISRFLCIGGKEKEDEVLNRVQLFELPVPDPYLEAIPWFTPHCHVYLKTD